MSAPLPKDKPLFWMGDSLDELKSFPEEVKRSVGFALRFAQGGEKHPDAEVMQGFGSAGVLEIIENHSSGTYRAVYTVQLEGVVYVLHTFQKKSKKGIATPQRELDKINTRLQQAHVHHASWVAQQEREQR